MSRRPSAGGALAISAFAFGCGNFAESKGAQALSVHGVDACKYEITIASERPLLLDVTANCKGRGIVGLETDDARVAEVIETATEADAPLLRQGRSFRTKRARPRARFHYRVNLERLAASENPNLALRSGSSLMAPVSSFLLYPLPLDVGVQIELSVESRVGFDFVSGLRRSGSIYSLQSHEIPVATYATFGAKFLRRVSLDGGQSSIEVAVLDGELRVSPDSLASWVQQRAAAVADFYGGFPAPRTLLVVAPVAGEKQVVFGKLLPESAPGVLLLIGSEAKEADLFDDWVLVHELFHIGVPSFYEEGKWFDEGLATYFEPIVRVRRGLLDEKALWSEFAREMPRGLAALTEDGLERARDFSGLYWGGAIYCLLADVQAREQSFGRLGLEHGIRRVFAAGGRAWDVWKLSRVLSLADAVYENPVLGPLRTRYADAPAPVDLEGVFEALGVQRQEDGIALRDDTSLAWVRRAITRGTP